MTSTALTFLLVAGVLLAAVTDLRWHKIPNALTFPTMVVGLIGHILGDGLEGFLFSIGGLVLGLGLLLGFYILGGMAAGDVKLLGAVGAILGPVEVFLVFLITAVLGGLYALGVMVHQLGITGAFQQIGLIIKTFFLTGKVGIAFAARNSAQPKLRYGLVIALGTLTFQFWYWIGVG
ncbi:MAG: A24 family peptidase [Nitrospirae bacterium]|nr:A24 family peptidase [Nitrospirota bacterium]